jgi:hypothetical protein
LFGRSRQSWYHLEEITSSRVLKKELVIELVEQIRSDLPKTGTIKLQSMLKDTFKDHRIAMGRAPYLPCSEKKICSLSIKNDIHQPLTRIITSEFGQIW